jgi:hypothetical protein
MAGNKKPRNKAYRPRPISMIGGIDIIAKRHDVTELMQPMSDGQITDLAVAFRLAFQQMLNGGASEENWCVCVCSLNIAMVLAERGIGEQYIGEINQSLEGAFRAKVRAGRTGAWGFDGDAIQAIKLAYEIHEEQLKLAAKHEIVGALREVHRRADAGNVFKEAA